MKVLLIDVNCKYTSTGKIVYDLYSELRRQGHEAFVAYGRGPKISEVGIRKFAWDIETYFHAFMTRMIGLTGFFSPISTHRLLTLIKRIQPDVVHLHELHGYFVNIGPIVNYLKTNQIPTVWTYHCEFMYTGKCGYTEECTRYTDQCGECPLLVEYPKSLFFDFTSYMLRKKIEWLSNFSALTIVTPSAWLRRKLLLSHTGHLPSMVIRNGIDTNTFKPIIYNDVRENLQITTPYIILSVIADFSDSRKGFDFIKPFAERLDSKLYTWIVVGGSQFPYEMPVNVLHVPKIKNPSELNKYYNASDVFVILSKYENLPTVCLEASACQCPVVGWDVGGVQEAIINVDYELFNYGSEKLIDGIQRIVKTKRPRIDRVLNEVSRSNISNKHIELYESLFGKEFDKV